jgi:hypothetical protein
MFCVFSTSLLVRSDIELSANVSYWVVTLSHKNLLLVVSTNFGDGRMVVAVFYSSSDDRETVTLYFRYNRLDSCSRLLSHEETVNMTD